MGKKKIVAESTSKGLHKKTPKSLKAKEKIAKESLSKKPAQAKEGETSTQAKDGKENGGKRIKDGKQFSGKSQKAEKRPNTQSGSKNEQHIDKKREELKKRDRQSTENHGEDRKEKVGKEIKDGKQVSGQSQRTEKCPSMQFRSKSDRLRDENRKKLKKRDRQSTENHGGMIFMCSTKTKPDCFRYCVMGVSANKQDVVTRIKPGLKLFLYDFDLKLLYGIYEASSTGGMKLEPAAFGGGFPAQVRFTVIEDCLPLPENVFKKAIKDNYDDKTRKFKIELSVAQVKQLIKLFRPAPWLQAASRSSLPESVPKPVIHHSSATTLPGDEFQQQVREPYIISNGAEPLTIGHESSPLFLTEKEYRSYGLRQGRQLVPNDTAAYVDHRLDPYRPDEGREQSVRNAQNDPPAAYVDLRLDPYRPDEGKEQSLRNVRNDHAAYVDHRLDAYRPDEGREQSLRNVPNDPAAYVDPRLDPYRPDEGREQSLRNVRNDHAAYVDHRLDPYRPDEGREQSLRNPASLPQKEAVPDPYFLSEKEYRNYGLKGYQELTTSVQPSIETDSTMTSTINLGVQNHAPYRCDPYNDSTTSLVNRYLSLPRTVAEPSESYSLTGREPYITESNYIRETGRTITERESRLPPYDPHALSQRYQYPPGNDPDYSSAPVSFRHSYAGHSASRY